MKEIINLKPIADLVEISDGYHTFTELYEHRIILYIKLCQFLHQVDAELNSGEIVWRSKKHSDGTNYEGWFILGIDYSKGNQITYHIPLSYWDDVEWATTLKKAPEFDGHTSQDILERLKLL